MEIKIFEIYLELFGFTIEMRIHIPFLRKKKQDRIGFKPN